MCAAAPDARVERDRTCRRAARTCRPRRSRAARRGRRRRCRPAARAARCGRRPGRRSTRARRHRCRPTRSSGAVTCTCCGRRRTVADHGDGTDDERDRGHDRDDAAERVRRAAATRTRTQFVDGNRLRQGSAAERGQLVVEAGLEVIHGGFPPHRSRTARPPTRGAPKRAWPRPCRRRRSSPPPPRPR